MKRCFDVGLASTALVVTSPLLLVIALVVRATSSGPAFFRQERVGRGFRRFRIFKFRSMYQDAAERGGSITVGEDARITRVGRLLRASKLDELPQLFNVLIGDMSFVGPRPEVPKYVEMFREEYREVLQVRPGITDDASIRFRRESVLLGKAQDPERVYVRHLLPEKIRLAKAYVRQRSLWMDAKIVARTLGELCSDRLGRAAPVVSVRGKTEPLNFPESACEEF